MRDDKSEGFSVVILKAAWQRRDNISYSYILLRLELKGLKQ
jgi:hypothetical protein